jgi:hypothetical protein
MRTTLDIPEALLREVQDIAGREGTTLPALVEQGLRKTIAEREAARRFRLRDASFAGQGLAADLRDADWNTLREIAYESRGG